MKLISRVATMVLFCCLLSPTTAHANVELSVQGVQAYSNGGCFYLVATPTEGETMNNYALALNVTGMSINNLFPSGFPPNPTGWEYNGITPAATTVGNPPEFVQQTDFSISQSFAVAQFVYDTATPAAVSFEVLGASATPTPNGSVGTSFGTDAGEYVTDDSFPITSSSVPKLIVPSVANASNLFAHQAGVYPGVCQDLVPVPEPSGFMFVAIAVSGWTWHRRRTTVTQSHTC